VRILLISLACGLFPSHVLAEACWREYEYKDQWLIRGSQCSENVSIKEFAKGYCVARVKGDVVRQADKCPATAKTREGAEVVTQLIVARCLGVTPPASGGQANTFYYGGSVYTGSRDSLREICTGFKGKWVEGAK
jgi:hypothetical protein